MMVAVLPLYRSISLPQPGLPMKDTTGFLDMITLSPSLNLGILPFLNLVLQHFNITVITLQPSHRE